MIYARMMRAKGPINGGGVQEVLQEVMKHSAEVDGFDGMTFYADPALGEMFSIAHYLTLEALETAMNDTSTEPDSYRMRQLRRIKFRPLSESRLIVAASLDVSSA